VYKRQALTWLATDGLAQDWLAVLHLLDLIRSANVARRARSLGTLAEHLVANRPPIEPGVRRTLGSAAFLAAVETEGSDRALVRPLAVALARELLASGASSDLALCENIRDHLTRLGVETGDIEALGLRPQSTQASQRAHLRNRFNHGRVYSDAV
jgi:hypothetical protein